MSPEQMALLFEGCPDALARTIEIADHCRFSLDELRYEYPIELTTEGRTPQQELERLTWIGARERYPDGITEKVRANLVHELALIAELEYAPYFLTVQDIVRFARCKVNPLRGPRVSRQQLGVLLPRHHRRRSGTARSPVRALHLGGPQRAAGYRRRLRARAPRGGDPVHLWQVHA